MSAELLLVARAVSESQSQVVPVVAQAGSALAPLIAVGVTGAVGLLLRPRELLRILRAKPWILAIMLGVVLGGWGLWRWITAPASTSPSASSATAGGLVGTDWSKVALEIIRQQHERPAAAAPAAAAAVPSTGPAATTPATAAAPFIFRGGQERSGFLGGVSPVGLKPAWTYRPQDDRFTMLLSSPAARDGRIYGASCLLEGTGSYGTVFCLDAASGRQLWLSDQLDAAKQTTFMGFFSSPALTADGRSLIIGQGLHTDFGAHLVCLDTASGTLRWSVPTPLHLEGSPAIEGDLVVIGAGAVEQGSTHQPRGDVQGAGNPGFVLGVRISTGAVVFRAPVNDPESSPLLVDGICYIGSGLNGNQVVALRTTSDDELRAAGQERRLWTATTPFPATGPVTMAGDTVLIGCGAGDFVVAAAQPEGRVLALDPATGKERWSTVMPDAVLGPVAVHGSIAIAPCRNGEVVALDLAHQGRELWRARVSGKAPILAGVAITGTQVYAVSNDGWLVVLDAADGKQRERVWLNDSARPGEMGLSTSAPLISDGRLYVGSETGGLRCFAGTP